MGGIVFRKRRPVPVAALAGIPGSFTPAPTRPTPIANSIGMKPAAGAPFGFVLQVR